MEGILEGLLFVAGDEGLTKEEIKNYLEIDDQELEQLLDKLKENYSNSNRGITIRELGNCFKLATKEDHKKYYEKFFSEEKNEVLSQSSLETLAIIAYNEPITRVQIDEIRGVSSVYSLRKLCLKGLVEEKGKSDLPGRPLLYGVTSMFLDHFGLKSIEDLPKLEVKEIASETDLFTSKYVEN